MRLTWQHRGLVGSYNFAVIDCVACALPEAFLCVYLTLQEAWPTHLPLLLEHLRRLDTQVYLCVHARICVCEWRARTAAVTLHLC